MLKWRLFLLFFCASMTLYGQGNVRQTRTKGLIYTREKGFNLSFNTAGMSVGYSRGRLKNYRLTPFWQFELGRLRHPKEYRQVAELSGVRNSKPFSYGKKNVFLTLRAMRGQKRYLSEKAKVKGVAIGWQYMVGLSLGLLKPYYLRLQYDFDPSDPTTAIIRTEKFSEENRDVFLDHRSIAGAAPFWKGLSEIKPLPGVHARIGVLFDWGAFDETVKSVDAGIMLDLYPKAVPIMIETRNYPFFLNLYVNFQLGKRS